MPPGLWAPVWVLGLRQKEPLPLGADVSEGEVGTEIEIGAVDAESQMSW